MPFIQQRKGVVLVVVAALVLLFAIAQVTLFSIVKYRLKNLEAFLNSMKAYYFMESAASVAVRDIAAGKIGRGAGQWATKNVAVTLGDKTFIIPYRVSKIGGNWVIECSISDPRLGDRTYHLRFGGLRAFPVFIRGYAGGK